MSRTSKFNRRLLGSTLCILGGLIALMACGGDASEEERPADAGGDSEIRRDGSEQLEDASSPDANQQVGDVCPLAPPDEGTTCDGDKKCTYVLCATDGLVVAGCQASTWTLSTTACRSVACDGAENGPCTADQICSITEGGSRNAWCVDGAACGKALEDCYDKETCRVNGQQVTCNTCPSGNLCP